MRLLLGDLFMDIFNYKVVPSLDLLKNDIISLIRPESKSFFNIHDPTGLRYLFQLRRSPLKGHKHCHNFTDTPSGTCQCNKGIEDTSHFLLSCPSYTVFFQKKFMHFCLGMTTHAESIKSDLQRGLDRRLRHTQH